MSAEDLVGKAYAAFNARDVEAALALMTEYVSWPKASEGGRVEGKAAIREYWARQWAEFDPRVEPLEMEERAEGKVYVRVHQVVRDLEGKVLADGEVGHVFTVKDGLIERMDIAGDEGGVASAFARG